MRLPTFLVALAAAFAAPAQQVYSEPTFSQVERLIGAVQEVCGDPAAYTAAVARASGSLYGKPTFSQVERLISEVRTNGAAVAEALSPSNITVMVAQSTGIHAGEPNVKTQFVNGVWASSGTVVANDYTVEIGGNARAPEVSDSNQAIAIGRDSLSAGAATVAVGPNSFAQGAQSVAMGWRANAVGEHSVSVGSAAKAHENYYRDDGSVNPNSDLQLASGDYSVAIGYNDKATGTSSIAIGNNAQATGTSSTAIGNNAQANAAGAVQLGTGVNSTPHTLQFEGVVVVKDGRIMGGFSEPATVDPSEAPLYSDHDYEVTVFPGSITTLMPSRPVSGGGELGISCTNGLRNYTVYVPNEPNTRTGLPMMMQFATPAGIGHTYIGPSWAGRLPVRFVVEQPYSGLVVISATVMDDGYDWTPIVTNCCLVYDMAGRFETSSDLLQGTSLQCGTALTLSYPVDGGGTNTVSLLTVPHGEPYVTGTLFARVPAFGAPYAVEGTPAFVTVGTPPDAVPKVPAVIRYTTVNGEAEFTTLLDVKQL